MEKNKHTKSVMRLYIGKNFSRYGRILFGRWFRTDQDTLQKQEALQELWENSFQEVTNQTYADWEALQSRIETGTDKESIIRSLSLTFIKYAAIVVLMLLTAGTTYWITINNKLFRQVEMAEIFVPYGESREIELPDGSVVWMDAGSLLVYPKDFTNMESRTIYLTGEASFTVKKDPAKPFIVKTTYLDVQALGTIFTVESYLNDLYTTATLEEGSVLVAVNNNNHEPVILKPDEQLVYSHTEQTFKIQSVEASLYKMQRSGYLIFENVSFNHLITSLERKFNITIHYNSQKYAGYYNVKFTPEETLEDVLQVLQQLIGIRYKINNNVVFIN